MNSEKGENNPDDEPSKGAANDQGNQSRSAKIEHFLKVLEYGGGLVFTAFAVILSESGFKKASYICGFGTIVCGVAIVTHNLEKFGLKSVRKWAVCLIFVMAILVGFLAFQKPATEPKPHFALLLNTSHAPDDFLWMTNDFLIFTNRSLSSPYTSSETNAYLTIPFNAGETNIVLNFSIVNDPASDSAIEAPEMQIILPIDVPLSFGDKWSTSGLAVPEHPERFLSFISPERTLLPASGVSVPELAFDPRIAFANSTYLPDGWVTVRLRGKAKNGEVLEQVICFWLIFVPMPAGSTNQIRPHLIAPTNIQITRTKTNSTFRLKFP